MNQKGRMLMKTKIILLLVVALAVVAGCRYDMDLSESVVEKERQAFIAQYKAERDKVLNRKYTSDTSGDAERCVNLLNLATNTYNKVLRWRTIRALTAAERSSIDAIKRYCDLWISNVDKEYENVTGSYSGIFHGDECMIFYNKAIYRLLMSQGEAERWRRIENLTWTLHGKRIVFSNGSTYAKLPWRFFEPNPYLADFDWVALIDEQSVFSLNGVDYAIVWVAGAGNLVGYPTTTEERVLVEIKGGEVSRYVGLHNVLGPDTVVLPNGQAQLSIQAHDGYWNNVRLVVDLRTMKIVGSLSTLPSDFKRDGYDKKFVSASDENSK